MTAPPEILPEILVAAPLPAFTMDALEAGFAVHRLWESPAPEVLARVRGTVPGNLVKLEGDRASGADSHDDKLIGIWEIQVLCPRPSLFDARDICSRIGDGRAVTDQASIDALVRATQADISHSLTPAQVLTTNLSASVTVQDFIKTQTFYTDFISRQGAPDPKDTRAFCANAVDALYKAGLNQFDAQQVLWAMDKAMPGLNTLDAAVSIGKTCPARDSGGVSARS